MILHLPFRRCKRQMGRKRMASQRKTSLLLSQRIAKIWFFGLLSISSVSITIIGSSLLSPENPLPWTGIRAKNAAAVFRGKRRNATKMSSEKISDGEFNGIPLYYVPPNKLTISKAHCVGENFHDDAWQYRSCELKHFCYDFNSSEFFVVASKDQNKIKKVHSNLNHTFDGFLSTSLDSVSVSIKVVTMVLLWRNTNTKRQFLPWKPSVRPPPLEGYYELPPDFVWIPIHTETEYAVNPGHLLWDYFLPIHALLSMFGHDSRLIPLVTDLNWRCTRSRHTDCLNMVSKLVPLLGVSPHTLSQKIRLEFNVAQNTSRRSNIVCARQALVGIGMLSDHGRNKHGQALTDYFNMRNMGRGPDLYRFRNFMLHNMGIDTVDEARKAPYQILLSQNSSKVANRRRDFEMQIAALSHSFLPDDITVRPLILADLTLEQQLRVLTQSSVYIGVMGGGAAFASFLPRGSTVILFYDDVYDWVKGRKNTNVRPVMMDWDFFNNAAYFHVHWFPISTMDNEEDLKLLVATIRNDVKARTQKSERKQQESSNSADMAIPRAHQLRNQLLQHDNVPDARINGIPLRYIQPQQQITSSVQCVGDNFHPNAWQFRSCEYEQLCFDTSTREFVVFASQEEIDTEEALLSLNKTFYGSISTRLNVSLALHSLATDSKINGTNEEVLLKWQPAIRPLPIDGYYELPPEIVWTPIHTQSENIDSPSHVLWDYLLPIFTLLSMFGHENKLVPFVTDQNLHCRAIKPTECFKMMSQFMPLLGVPTDSFSNTFETFAVTGTDTSRRSNIVCSQRALVGVGMLNAHDTNYKRMRNVGRGPELYRFRNFMLRNMGIDTIKQDEMTEGPFQVLVSQQSSKNSDEQNIFEMQIAALKQGFSSYQMLVKPLALLKFSLREQLQVLGQSVVYIGVTGGDAALASFLPRGSTVVLFFNDIPEDTSSDENQGPEMMDWDFFNNASYLRVHWFPLSTMNNEEDLKLLITTIRHDVEAREASSMNDE